MSRRELAGQGVRYVVVGAYNTLFTLAVFWVLDRLWGAVAGVQVVFWTSSVVGILNGFVSQRIFVWRSKKGWRAELSKFFVLNLAVAILNSLALLLTVTMLGLPAFPSQVGITLVLVVIAFFLNRAWVFGARPAPPA